MKNGLISIANQSMVCGEHARLVPAGRAPDTR